MAKISELIKILRGEGNIAGARRAERIGDEASYAAERISADELRRTLSGMGDNAESLAIITPEEFRYLAEQLPEEYVNRPATQQHIADLQNIAQEKGFRDIPFLSYNEYPGVNQLGVFGHEGRHRMRALENLGDEKALVRLIPRGDVREPLPRRSRSEFLQALAEKYGDPLYLDPESYNQQVIPMRSKLKSELLQKPTALERAGANFDMEEFRNKYGYTGRKRVQPFQAGGLAKFFSAVDEAVANLRQKKGTGEQMLKEIQKAPGVKKEELELRRLPEKLAGQQKVTQEDIQAMLRAVPAPKLSMTMRSDKPQKLAAPELEEWIGESDERRVAVNVMGRHGYEPVQNPEDPGMLGFLSPDGDIVDKMDMDYVLETDLEMVHEAMQEAKARYFDMFDQGGGIKPGIDRETVAEASRDYAMAKQDYDTLQMETDAFRRFVDEWEGSTESVKTPKFENYTTKGPKQNYRELLIQLERPDVQDSTKPYVQPAHFPEEDIVVHARVDDRVGPNGEKILYVEEIQSDWHQDARKARLNEAKKRVSKGSIQAEISDAAIAQMREELGLPEDAVIPSAADSPEVRQRFEEVFGELEDARINEEAKKLPKDFGYKEMGTRTPPWQQTSHELAIKQIFDTAAREGYDKVMFSPGSEQVKRYSLGEYLDEIKVSSQATSSGTVYNLQGLTKEGQTIDRTFKNKKELAEHIGDDKAKMALERIAENKASGSKDPAILTGEDLLLGGKKAQGKLKIYDEILPNYVQKYAGKEFNIQPGKTSIDADNVAMSDRRYAFAQTFLNQRKKELQKAFEEGDIPVGVEDIEGEILDRARQSILQGFEPGYSLLKERFAEQFAPKFNDDLSELGGSLKTDYEGLINELDPSSFRENAMRVPGMSWESALDLLDPGKIRFRDPEKQELFEDWLEGQIIDESMNPFIIKGVTEPRFKKMAEDELAARGEDFYKDMELPPRLEGMSVDITPEMREKITSRGQPLFVVPPAAAAGAAAVLSEEEQPVEGYQAGGKVEERNFQKWIRTTPWFQEYVKEYGEEPNLDIDEYDYRAAWKAGVVPERDPYDKNRYHWPSVTPEGAPLKSKDHPTAWKEKYMREFGVNPDAIKAEKPVGYKEAGRVEKKEGLAKEQFASPFDETRRIGPRPGLGSGPARIRDLTKILRGEDSEAKNVERQRIAGNVKSGEEFGEYMYDMLVPQTPWEFALEAAFGPVGKLGRKGLLAASGAMYDPDAEAGRIRLLHGSPSKIDRLEEGRELWASTDPEYALKRAMDKMRFAQGAQGPGYLNQFEMEDTDLMRLVDKYSPEDIEVARRAFAKLPQGREVTGEEIYELASTNTGGAKTAALENVARALGKKGYQVPAGADDKGEWYRVLDQTDLERFGRGGKVVDALKDVFKMTDTAPDPSRRKAIGLREKIAEPGALTTVEKELSASDLDTLQRIPMSRRDVLRAGAGQAMSAMAPRGALGALMKAAASPAEVMKQAVAEPFITPAKKALSSPMSIQALIAKALKEGGAQDTEEVMEYIFKQNPRRRPRTEEGMDDLEARVLDLMYPESYEIAGVYRESPGPLELMKDIISYERKQDLRQVLRQIREANPEHYEQLKRTSREIDEFLRDEYGDELDD